MKKKDLTDFSDMDSDLVARIWAEHRESARNLAAVVHPSTLFDESMRSFPDLLRERSYEPETLLGFPVIQPEHVPEGKVVVIQRDAFRQRLQVNIPERDLTEEMEEYVNEIRMNVISNFGIPTQLLHQHYVQTADEAPEPEPSKIIPARPFHESIPDIEWQWVIPTLVALVILFWVLFG